ncbi:site-specific integrase [Zhongshania sp. BJYM1]|uniref:site-specific integrase n=1 Tax=Zhongshania aquatica TaxID=2965069 RepID=UPI0022B391D7|nr:site-specific integrase [Marortus sp. BJYM1]
MGSVRTRGDSGRLFFEFRYMGKRCREQTMLPDTPANRSQMEKALKKIEAAITLGQFNYLEYFPQSRRGHKLSQDVESPLDRAVATTEVSKVDTPTFGEFAETWLAENKVRWRKATYDSQVGQLNKHVLPRFASKRLNAISKAELLAFRGDLAKLPGPGDRDFLSPKTLNEIMGTAQAIIKEASDRYEFPNPSLSIQRLKVPKNDIKPFDLNEVTMIIDRVRKDYRNYMIVRFFTGVRSGELHGLKWKFIDFERRQILVRETFTKGRTEYTKNDGSQREIQMSDSVFTALKSQFEATGHVSEYVFCNSLGRPLDNKNFTDRVWYPLLRYLALDARRPYQTRHTAATLWLAAGESPEWIARQMGHTSTEMLFRVYSRYVPNLTRNDGSAFNRLILSSFPSAPTQLAHNRDDSNANDGIAKESKNHDQ